MNIIEKLQIAVQSVKMTTEEIGGSIEVRLDGLTKDELYNAAKEYGANVLAKDHVLEYYHCAIQLESGKIILTTKTK